MRAWAFSLGIISSITSNIGSNNGIQANTGVESKTRTSVILELCRYWVHLRYEDAVFIPSNYTMVAFPGYCTTGRNLVLVGYATTLPLVIGTQNLSMLVQYFWSMEYVKGAKTRFGYYRIKLLTHQLGSGARQRYVLNNTDDTGTNTVEYNVLVWWVSVIGSNDAVRGPCC
jgi:hypothetical protein